MPKHLSEFDALYLQKKRDVFAIILSVRDKLCEMVQSVSFT